jgi:methyl-accepting chemotaxis protein
MVDNNLLAQARASQSPSGPPRKNWWTVGRKIISALAASIILSLMALIWFAADSQTRNMVDLSDDAANEITRLMSVQMGAAVRFNQTAALEQIFAPQVSGENATIASLRVIKPDGDVVASYDSDRLQPAQIDTGRFAGIEAPATVDTGSHYVVAVPIRFGNDNALVGSLVIGWSRALIDAKTAASAWTVAGVALALVVGLMLLLAVLLRGIVSRPISRLQAAMTRLADGDVSVDVPNTGRGDEIGGMANAVQIFKDNAIAMRQMEADKQRDAEQAEADKRRAMEAVADSFEATVKGIVDGVSKGLTDMRQSAESMAEVANQSSEESLAVAGAAEQATSNVNTVAAAAEEMSKSVAEIGQRVEQSTKIANQAVTRAESTDTTVKGLAEAANKIGEVVKMISDIAEQTNLLALNATIEAARAGDAGKGFAVVASEVKNLATQTARATEQISSQIGEMQSVTGSAVSAIQEIRETIVEVSDVFTTIAASIEEQGAATQEIARNTSEAASGTQSVTERIGNVKTATESTGGAAAKVLEASTALASQAGDLRREVDGFLNKVRAA